MSAPPKMLRRIVIDVEAADESALLRGVRALLKHMLRSWGLRCVGVKLESVEATEAQQ